MKVLFLYLKSFSGVGGIEKFNRAFLKALQEVGKEKGIEVKAYSVYDEEVDKKYFDPALFKGFEGNKIRFLVESIVEGLRSDIVILGHINLSPVGLAIKKMNGRTKIFLIAHGIDVWRNLSKLKKWIINNSDMILSVSNFTKRKIIENNNVPHDKILIFPNTIDPYFKIPSNTLKPEYLLKRYKLTKETKVILTVARLSSSERYKGYDKIIQVLPEVIKEIPEVKYLLVGKGDGEEMERLKEIIKNLNLVEYVVLAGYVPDEELTDHYLLSDVFVMPSKKEGFGIVFLEAMACGIPVIAGNKDGSVDALMNGELGTLVDPDNIQEISRAIIKALKGEVDKRYIDKDYLRNRVIETFGYEKFKTKLEEILKAYFYALS